MTTFPQPFLVGAMPISQMSKVEGREAFQSVTDTASKSYELVVAVQSLSHVRLSKKPG